MKLSILTMQSVASYPVITRVVSDDHYTDESLASMLDTLERAIARATPVVASAKARAESSLEFVSLLAR